MLKTKQSFPIPPKDIGGGNIVTNQWVYGRTTNSLKVGDIIEALVGGRGRGGHGMAYATVVKINKKSVTVRENPGSYCAGKQWQLSNGWAEDNVTVVLPRISST